MMRRARRLVFFILLAGSVAAAAFWFVHVPRRPDRLARAIPAGARWISVHREPAARWRAVAAHPLVRDAVRRLGAEPSDWDAIAASTGVHEWVGRLASDTLVVARLPLPPGRHAWCAASWIGGRAQRFRKLLLSGLLRDFTTFTEYRGRPVWLLRADWIPPDWNLAVAIEEGLLFACLSENPSDIFRMLDAYDGVAPRDPVAARLARAADPDRAIWRLGAGPGPDDMDALFSRFDAGGIDGVVRLYGWSPPFPPALQPAVNLRSLANLLGGHPAAVAVLHPATAETLAAPFLDNGWRSDVWQAVRGEIGAPLVAALYGDALGGRLYGLRIPGLTISSPLRNAPAFPAVLDRLLDRLNATMQWGLIRGPMAGAPELNVIEGTGAGPYARLPAGERVALLIEDGWLTVAPSAETLRTLSVASSARVFPQIAEWTVPPGFVRKEWVWVDLARTSEILRHALSVHALRLQIEDREGSRPARARIETWRETLSVAGGLGRIALDLDPAGGQLTVRFHVGRPAVAAR